MNFFLPNSHLNSQSNLSFQTNHLTQSTIPYVFFLKRKGCVDFKCKSCWNFVLLSGNYAERAGLQDDFCTDLPSQNIGIGYFFSKVRIHLLFNAQNLFELFQKKASQNTYRTTIYILEDM